MPVAETTTAVMPSESHSTSDFYDRRAGASSGLPPVDHDPATRKGSAGLAALAFWQTHQRQKLFGVCAAGITVAALVAAQRVERDLQVFGGFFLGPAFGLAVLHQTDDERMRGACLWGRGSRGRRKLCGFVVLWRGGHTAAAHTGKRGEIPSKIAFSWVAFPANRKRRPGGHSPL